ncbi:right-handed parallel beta-helix repeat-containing protein [Paragemmobacter straminiformis]|uniref:Right-handed parallel beta-helix repeat-containing protein n=1 Tax=Paragemmobacter straminiformis TaxID=2045119 RepID=A0A842I6G7_9RHOB|nr:right-handed parallel beta-helix repeat-containing protein [Gemmobacter straminiformis]MBC2835216.1 right-handed parallel beta-helix repeat-containing protein [Gemmobacter straminiformis]
MPRVPAYKRVVRDLDVTRTLDIEGPEWNDTLVLGCNVHKVRGDGIRIRNVRNLTIRGCHISDIKGVGILLRSTGGTSGVWLVDNLIEGTDSDGIAAAQRAEDGVDHTGLVIGWNRIDTTGRRGHDGRQHGIYSQASDAVIVSNRISGPREGNGISVRSSSLVACNTVSGTSRDDKPGIRYYADHVTGPSKALIIRGNRVTGSSVGIDIMDPPGRNADRMDDIVRSVEVTGNRSERFVLTIAHFWLKNKLIKLLQKNNEEIQK